VPESLRPLGPVSQLHELHSYVAGAKQRNGYGVSALTLRPHLRGSRRGRLLHGQGPVAEFREIWACAALVRSPTAGGRAGLMLSPRLLSVGLTGTSCSSAYRLPKWRLSGESDRSATANVLRNCMWPCGKASTPDAADSSSAK
jgi:hypothetical protein